MDLASNIGQVDRPAHDLPLTWPSGENNSLIQAKMCFLNIDILPADFGKECHERVQNTGRIDSVNLL